MAPAETIAGVIETSKSTVAWLAEGALQALGRSRPLGPREPPVFKGRPWLGNVIELSRSLEDFFSEGLRLHGPVFQFKIANQPCAAMIGARYNQLFFEQTDRTLSMREAYKFVVKMFSDRAYFLAPTEEYEAQRAQVLPLFNNKKMGTYVKAMALETDLLVQALGTAGDFECTELFNRYAVQVATRAFFGDEARAGIGTELSDLFRDFSLRVEPAIPTWVPMPKFIRSDRARARLRAFVKEQIALRRAYPGKHDDLLETFVNSEGIAQSMPPEVQIDVLLALLWGGHETTSGHLSFSFADILRHPEVLARVKAEQDQLGVLPPTLESLGRMEYLGWALKEVERLHPVAAALARQVSSDLEVDGYTVRRGTLLFIAPVVSHRLPEVFPDPLRFDPERFSPERREDRAPGSLVGFGGARHRCTGVNFAYSEMKTVWARMIHEYDLQFLDGPPQYDARAGTGRPKAPCRVRYRRRADRSAAIHPGGEQSSVAAAAIAAGCPFHIAQASTPKP
jgi:sterol 14-demethylase